VQCLRRDAVIKKLLILMMGIIVLWIFIPGNTVKAADRESGFSKIEDQIYATLVSEGYSHAGACGVLGNIYAENPAFIADLEANDGATYGLFQWTDTGKRRRRMIIWCNNHLLESDTITGQMAFAIHEIEGGDAIASRLSDYLKATENAKEAAMEFAVGFERCIGTTKNSVDDGIYEGNLYPEYSGSSYQALAKRMEAAERYDEGFSNYKLRKRDILPIREALDRGIVDEVEDNIEITILKSFDIKPQYSPWKLWLYRLVCILIGYAFGCILVEDIIARQVRHASIFEIGDKVPHFRNVYKYLGRKEALVEILLEVIKMGLAFLIAYLVTKGALLQSTILWTGLGAVLGHDFPVWNKFRGGYGVVLTGIVFIAYLPLWGSISCALGIISAIVLKSFPVGALVNSVLMIPFVFAERGWVSGLLVMIFAVLIIVRQYKTIVRFFRKHGEKIRIAGYFRSDRTKRAAKNRHKEPDVKADRKSSTKDFSEELQELRELTFVEEDFEANDFEYEYVNANPDVLDGPEEEYEDNIEPDEGYNTEYNIKYNTNQTADLMPDSYNELLTEESEIPNVGKADDSIVSDLDELEFIDIDDYAMEELREIDRKYTSGYGLVREIEFTDEELDSYESELEYYGEEIFALHLENDNSDEKADSFGNNNSYEEHGSYESNESFVDHEAYENQNLYESNNSYINEDFAADIEAGTSVNEEPVSDGYVYTEEFVYEGQSIFDDYLPQPYGKVVEAPEADGEESLKFENGIEVAVPFSSENVKIEPIDMPISEPAEETVEEAESDFGIQNGTDYTEESEVEIEENNITETETNNIVEVEAENVNITITDNRMDFQKDQASKMDSSMKSMQMPEQEKVRDQEQVQEQVQKVPVKGHTISLVNTPHNSYGVKDNPFDGYYSKEAERKNEPKLDTSLTQLSRSNFTYDKKEKTFSVRPDNELGRTICVSEKKTGARNPYSTDPVVVNKISRNK